MHVSFCYNEVGATPRYIVDQRHKEPGVFVPDMIRKCVAFVGIAYDDGRFVPKATGFFALAGEGDIQRSHFVTAEHVVVEVGRRIAKDESQGIKGKLAIRLNLKGGTSEVVRVDQEKWWFHPDEQNRTDVAVLPASFQQQYFDHFALPLYGSVIEHSGKNDLRRRGAALGQEVAIVGLFRVHHGRERNEPIVRVGNIAAMPEDRVKTTYCGLTEGYLVEARSIGDLSGSPVFVNLWDNSTPQQMHLGFPKLEGMIDFGRYMLFGLMHGHWDLPNLSDDAVVEDQDGRPESINTGIGVVIPVHKIIETLYHPELVDMRKKLEEKEREDAAKPDVDDDADRPASELHPKGRERFNSLLAAAMKNGLHPVPKTPS
jgi:hypothetical protein